MAPKILDACCGPRMFWLDKHHKDTVYVDKRFVDCWEKTAFVDEDEENDEGNENQDKFKERRDENGWYICPCCGEKVANPVDSGFCAECDYKKKHPNAQKKCSGCAFADFRYNDAPVGSGRSTFLCTKHHKYRDYGDVDCGEWEDRFKEETK